MWIGNTTPENAAVHLAPLAATAVRQISMLDEAHFAQAAANPGFMDNLQPATTLISLSGYGVLRLVETA